MKQSACYFFLSAILFLFQGTSWASDVVVTELNADGPKHGLTAYELIRNFGGPKSIESPDLYPGNHPETPHIFEATDEVVGHHFVFTIHKNHDKDRDKYIKFSDRQRNEIKVYAKSKNDLKGFQGESLHYSWKFKIGESMSISKNFTHLFQLKSVDDGIGMPILTISGANLRGQEKLILSHAPVQKAAILATAPWQSVLGRWLDVTCTVHYENNGGLNIKVVDIESGKTIITYTSDNIDMWRGIKKTHFVRPKWGIYRSLKSKHMLRDEEEQVSFADFKIIKELK